MINKTCKWWMCTNLIPKGRYLHYSRQCYNYEVQPIPCVSKVCERLKYEPTSHHLDCWFECVDPREDHPLEQNKILWNEYYLSTIQYYGLFFLINISLWRKSYGKYNSTRVKYDIIIIIIFFISRSVSHIWIL